MANTALGYLLESAYHWESMAPDRVYMVQPTGRGQVQTFTWKQALDQARRMAAHLRSLDLPPASHIALISKNCAHFILADLAIWMAGHVSVALYPTLSRDTVGYILEHCQARLLFVGKLDTWEEIQQGLPRGLPCISFPLAPPNDFDSWDEIIDRGMPIEGNPTRPGRDLATIIYTSGSTGRPKGVMHSFEAMTVAARGASDLLGIRASDRRLSYLPLAHVMERWIVECGSLVCGIQVFFADSPETFIEDLKRARPTHFISVPRLWQKFQLGVFEKISPNTLDRFLSIPIVSRLIKKKILSGLGLDSVRLAYSGSAPIAGELIEWYRKLGLDLMEGYGMTEDFGYSHVSLPGQARVGYVGSPYPGVDVRISADGEVLVKSPGAMMGYYKQADLTAGSYTADGFFKTGDRGLRDQQGRLKITGRTSELFKTSKGKYVAPAPIESLLNNDPWVELSCVTGAGRVQPYALLTLAEEICPPARATENKAKISVVLEDLLDRVNRQVENHERLQFLVVASEPWQIENGFLTPTMKIRRAALEAYYDPLADDWYGTTSRVIWHG